ncbi:ribokinase [Citrobacter freundii]|uniref:PfkB family carbohydrate kinase n=1 Tax=Citrobacter freundii TaxID=546 RepID=UPI000C80CD3B|nr:PfkB family carbohydrate kinase [Citrobacter freundii]EMB4337300.1 ribokinase [Citrobacter freundii]MBJ9041946.1 ribokinase [Citrobacter freundii]NTY76554.1 ribokinase [Citrobacter freundii]NUA13002.1 ribokinase [Citrobacter freundii]PMD03431.1 ribokinase [Citrobacter freundii]
MKAIGIGDNVVDKYEHQRIRYPGGNALNFSVYAGLLGAESAYLGIFGTDAAADHLQRTLTARGIDFTRCRQVAGENGYARLTIEQGERLFLGSNLGGVRQTESMDFILQHSNWLSEFDLLHTSSYSYIDALLPELAQLPGWLSYDFSDDFDPVQALPLCRWLDSAFFSCAGWSLPATRQLLQQVVDSGSNYAIATRGAEGALLFDGSNWRQQAPLLITPVDTLGAGDAFITAFLLALRTNGDIAAAMEAGAAFAAKICLLHGAFGEGEAF